MSIEARLKITEDREAISRLKVAYCDAADGGWNRPSHDGEAVSRLFTHDGIWSAGKVGEATGPKGICALFAGFSPLHFAFHCITNPAIDLHGDNATGQWHFVARLTHETDGPLLAGGIYHDAFRRTPEGWRFTRLFVEMAFFRPMHEGWDDIAAQAQFHPRGNTV